VIVLVQALVLLPTVALALRLTGVERLRRLLRALPGALPAVDGDTALVQALAISSAVAAAVRLCPWRPTCLHRALVLWLLLHRRGVPSAVHLGVRSDGGSMAFHAWIESNGRVLNDRADIGADHAVVELPRIPLAKRRNA
jgi:hypothetical protein